jgi:hypothetical protein
VGVCVLFSSLLPFASAMIQQSQALGLTVAVAHLTSFHIHCFACGALLVLGLPAVPEIKWNNKSNRIQRLI